MSLAPGVRLGAYEIVAALGAGGMGEVYRARDTRVGREVAIKILPAEFSSDPERLTRFEQEARASASLNHPNIVALFDVGQHQGAPFIVSELLEGQTLRERLHGSPLPVRKAIELAIQVAQGLAAAHERGIVHRDLKPENIFITEDGRAKILDFGLAKLTQPQAALSGISVLPTTPLKTMPGVVLGTIGYMSPEQVRGHEADHRADIFALGAILYETLAGRRAFEGDTPMDAMSAILKEDPPDLPSTGDRPIPPALARIVDRCLEKNPSARFQSTRDLAFALEGLSSHSGTVTALAPVARPFRRVFTGIAATAGAIMFVITAWLAVAHVRESPSIAPAVRFTVAPPDGATFAGGSGFAPAQAVSPDGRSMVFMAQSGPQRAMLWIRSLDSLDARPLPGTEGATFPFWSPDSSSIAFFAQGKLRRMNIAGGPSQIVADASAGEGGTWSKDDVIVFAPSARGGLLRVSAKSTAAAAATTLDDTAKELSHRWPHFLPDGRRFVFLAAPSNEVRLGSLDTSETKTLLKADSKAMYANGYLLFLREDVLMAHAFDASKGEITGEAIPVVENVNRGLGSVGRAAFSVSASGILTYRGSNSGPGLSAPTWFDRSGKELGVAGEPNGYMDLNVSPDGKRAAVAASSQRNFDILLLDLGRGVSTRFTLDAGAENQPIWSSDSKRLVFGSAKTGATSDIYTKAIDGSAEQLVFGDVEAKYPFTWSPDERFIIYGTAGSDQNLWLLSLTDRKPTPFRQTPFSEFAAQFSPDGKWVAYRSNESGESEIYIAPFPGPGEKVRVSSSGAIGGYPRWRRDGKELFWLATDQKIMSATIDIKGSLVQVGEVRALFQARPAFGRFPFDVTADGQKFLVLTTSQQSGPDSLTVILNWTAALRDRRNP
jgi:eukaryotic-like serine/threonine-protein kinase